MRRLLFLICILSGFSVSAKLKAYFSYAVFNSQAKGPYVETYLTITGSTCVFKKEKGVLKGSVHVMLKFLQGGNQILTKDYNIISQAVKDSSAYPNFIDLQRFNLPNGKYDLEIELKDNNIEVSEPFSAKTEIVVKIDTLGIALSDIQLLESFSKTTSASQLTKSGYDLFPFGVNYYPDNLSKINFYSEAYRNDSVFGKNEKFVFFYYIESYETLEKIEGFFAFQKSNASSVNPLLAQIDISKLVSGSYNLVVEVRDRANILHAQKKLYIQRRNLKEKIALENIDAINPDQVFTSKYTNVDTLREYVACLWPISSVTERDWQMNQIKNANEKTMQQYLYAFWKNRNDKDPEAEWMNYKQQVDKANRLYPCGKIKSYFTDRGRVYLQYGPPDASQQVSTEPDSYPYEIWQYYRLKDPATGQLQSNKRFVFYNKDLDGYCYTLLHSDARGELKEPRWQLRLKQRTTIERNFDKERPGKETYGSQAEDIFINPR